MPIQQCRINGRSGYKWGKSGKCYTGSNARAKAAKQAAAIRTSGWIGNSSIRVDNAKRRIRAQAQIVRSNPLKSDPTRTKMLRAAFERDLRKRYARLRSEIVDLVLHEDAFGLKVSNVSFAATTLNQRFAFATSSEKVAAYQEWIQSRYDNMVLDTNDAYWERYIADGYEKGGARAFSDTYKARRAMAGSQEQQAYYQGTKEQFLQDAFGNPESLDKVKLLASRTLTDLKGVNNLMATQMSQALVNGFTQGMGAIALSKSLTDIVGGNDHRAMTIARTEIIRAHAEGQLDAMEKMGVEEVGVMVEWSSAGDDRVCPLCMDLDGIVLKISEARGLIPRHPNCRCCHVPANVGEPLSTKRRVNYGDGSESVGQTRSKEGIESSIRDSIAKERKKGSIDEKIRRSRWTGADRVGRIARVRPSSPLYPAAKTPKVPAKSSVPTPKSAKTVKGPVREKPVLRELKSAAKDPEMAKRDTAINHPDVLKNLKVPPKIYHVTSRDNLASIKKTGLRASAKTSSEGEMLGTYLTDNPEDVIHKQWDLNLPKDKIVVLEVDTKGLELRLDPEYFYWDDISKKGAREYVQAINNGEETLVLYSRKPIDTRHLKVVGSL